MVCRPASDDFWCHVVRCSGPVGPVGNSGLWLLPLALAVQQDYPGQSYCLASRPSLILLDEPFAGIDPVTIDSVQDIIAALCASGIAVLLTDHREKETLGVTDRAYVVYQGKVLVSGTPGEVLANKQAQDVYFGRQDTARAA